jgi:hypothetical protein
MNSPALRNARTSAHAARITSTLYFGKAAMPQNVFDTRAGLDVSPAIRHYLGISHNELTYWRFAEKADVPEGPWTEIVTTSGNNR